MYNAGRCFINLFDLTSGVAVRVLSKLVLTGTDMAGGTSIGFEGRKKCGLTVICSLQSLEPMFPLMLESSSGI